MVLSHLRLAIVLTVAVVSAGPESVTRAAVEPELRIENERYRIVVERKQGTPAALVVSRLDQPGASRRLTPGVRVLVAKTIPVIERWASPKKSRSPRGGRARLPRATRPTFSPACLASSGSLHPAPSPTSSR